ncbi:dna-invertase from lambdoid prophage e14 [Escherichia coli]|uniref:Recombinase family protein n=4 Tax=Escherichia coli TaxID=562 RepID=A0A9Q9T183_ECOLX|nr:MULTISPECIES: recombinase family protein [Enterobacteriaceae]MDY7196067.1 recombinase family protein [Escherichia coli]UYA94420.1 recombinase family protein [Escherichia coli]STH79974.1 dna-invertase from lambdoid prophage e14 [Escherichia coli]
MKIGYARKSTHLQDVAHQVDELTKAGCEQIYQDQTSRSGPKRDKKGALELENCLKALREGDTLVVWALDRLGGSLGQVITLLDDLKKRGITFIAIKDRIDTNAPVIGEIGTVAKLAMRQPFVLFKGLTFQKLCLPGAFRPGDHHNKMLRPGLCVVHASPQYL